MPTRKKIFQSYNNKIDKWVKFKILPSGKAKIMDVKQKNPTSKFRGVPVRKKR